MTGSAANIVKEPFAKEDRLFYRGIVGNDLSGCWKCCLED